MNDNFTLVFRGEIYLEGATSLTLESDGPSMAQLAVADGIAYDVRMYDEVSMGNPTVMVTPPRPGWYPIRVALTDTVGVAVIKLTNGGGPIARARLRSLVKTTGLVVEGFESPVLATSVGLGIADHDLLGDLYGRAVRHQARHRGLRAALRRAAAHRCRGWLSLRCDTRRR